MATIPGFRSLSGKHALLAMTTAALTALSPSLKAATLSAQINDQKHNRVADAVVTLTPTDSKLLPANMPLRDEVDQIDKDFVPRVKVVMQGTRVFFPNKDNIRHHVYSLSPAKIFELPLYTGTPAEPVVFDQSGAVVLGCNIHDWMVGYIFVTDTPWHGKSGSDGNVVIDNVPAGEYILKIWHPQLKGSLGEISENIELKEGEPVEKSWQLDLKPTFKIPRTSGGAGNLYR